MSDTIFYDLTLKKNKTADDVFSKIQRAVKKNGPTKRWNCSVESDTMLCIDFGDEKSEPFVLHFIGKTAAGFCKVFFPLPGEPLYEDDKKSELKAFVALLHSIRSCCSEMHVHDDYDIASELFNSMDYKMIFRELTQCETERLDRLFQLGYTDHEDFLLAIFAEELGLPEDFDWLDVLNPGIKIKFDPFPFVSSICETYLYETSLLNKRTLHQIYRSEYATADDTRAEVYAFILGVGILFKSYSLPVNTHGRGAQVSKYYTDKFLPAFEKADAYEKCRLAYRLMQSIYDYCGFTYVGKENTAQVLRSRYDRKYRFLSANLKSWYDIFMAKKRSAANSTIS